MANPAQKLLQHGMKKPKSRYQKSPYQKPLQEQLCVAYRIVATWLSPSEKTFPASDIATPKRAILRGSRSTWPMPWQRGYSATPKKVQLKPLAIQKRMTAVEPAPNLFDWIFRQYTILSTIMLTNWWYMGMAGELDEYLCPHGCEKKMDFVGLDYYWGIPSLHIERIQRLIEAAYRHFDQAPVWPGALYDILKDLSQKFPNHPIIICENGSVKVADGWEREKYIREHVMQVQRAIKDGMKVEAYLYWAITSNREWDLEFNDASDFGLYNIDLDHDPALTRKRTPEAADAYEQIIKDRRG